MNAVNCTFLPEAQYCKYPGTYLRYVRILDMSSSEQRPLAACPDREVSPAYAYRCDERA
eukprot:COSAG06_NODE_106_length_23773_cov_20.279083_1_plen_59_part_00